MPLIVDIHGVTGGLNTDRISTVLSHAFDALDAAPSGTWHCAVKLAEPAEISTLHRQFFGDASDTDVMSFPSGEPMDSLGGYLGDIAISIATARDQAHEVGHSLAREVAFLAIHGLLHLVGFDDVDDAGREEMLSLQDELLASAETTMGTRL